MRGSADNELKVTKLLPYMAFNNGCGLYGIFQNFKQLEKVVYESEVIHSRKSCQQGKNYSWSLLGMPEKHAQL